MTRDCDYRSTLSQGWLIQAAADVASPGEAVSAPGFDTTDWLPTTVPSTVLAALVANGLYKDPYFGMNLREIPTESFEQPWWYRAGFSLSEKEAPKTVLLEFDGITCGQYLGQRAAHRHRRRCQGYVSTVPVRSLRRCYGRRECHRGGSHAA